MTERGTTGRARWRATARLLGLCVLVVGLVHAAGASVPIITTVAGGGDSSADGVPATSTSLSNPSGVAVDSHGNVYLINTFRVRKVSTSGVITTVAGNGTSMYDGDGKRATDAGMDPRGIAVDAAGNLYIADGANNRVRKVSTAGIISTIAGTGAAGYSGDGGNALQAAVGFPDCIAADASGNVYVCADAHVRKIVPGGNITLFAGNGDIGVFAQGPATATGVVPAALATDAAGNVYIADQSTNTILEVTAGQVRAIAGGGHLRSDPMATSVKLLTPTGVAVDARGNVYFSELYNLVRMVTPRGVLQVVAGTFNDTDSGSEGGAFGFSGDGGPADRAMLASPQGVAIDSANNLYVVDAENRRIRKVTPVTAQPVPPGAGAFAPMIAHVVADRSVYGDPQVVAVADVTGDGRDDVLLTMDYRLVLYVQRADGTLSGPLGYSYPGYSLPGRGVVGVDLNHDGLADAVVGLRNGLAIYLGAPGGLSSRVIVPGVTGAAVAWSVVPLDMDGDGNLDIAASSLADATGALSGITIFYGDGRGGVSRKMFIPKQDGDGTDLKVADFNRDGRPDLASTWATDAQHGGVQVLLHDTSGSFHARLRIAGPLDAVARNSSSALAVGDFDGDGRVDLISSDNSAAPDSVVYLYRQSSNGQFAYAKRWPTYDNPAALVGADVGGDGYTDLLLLHQGAPALGYQKQLGGSLSTAVKFSMFVVNGLPSTNRVGSLAIGDIDSDGCPDAVLADGAYGLATLSGTHCLDVRTGSATATGDFNCDGRADVLWRHARTGSDAIWRSGDASKRQAMAAVTVAAWKIVAVGDFDGDHVSDVFWRNIRTGSNTIWRAGNAASLVTTQAMTDPTWYVVGAGDFDGDGRDDILWRNSRTGANVVWKGGNFATRMSLTGVSSPDWDIVAIGDFDGDHHDDLFWRNAATGADVIWRSANAATSLPAQAVTALAWKVVGVGDFDGDGRSDILWRHIGSGANTIWRSGNGATLQTMTGVTSTAWQVAGIGDFDGDHKADVLWRNYESGANVIWRSANGATTQPVTGVTDLAWKLVPSSATR